MRNVPKLLDRARELCSPPTDYQLAKRLDVSPQRLSNWRRQDSGPDNEAAWKLAKMLGLPITDVIAYIEEDKARDPKKRAWWEAQLPRVLSAIAIAAALYSGAGRGPLIAETHGANITTGQVIYYAKSKLQAAIRSLLSGLAAWGQGWPPDGAIGA